MELAAQLPVSRRASRRNNNGARIHPGHCLRAYLVTVPLPSEPAIGHAKQLGSASDDRVRCALAVGLQGDNGRTPNIHGSPARCA